jgi:hypothetical protein
MAPNNELVLLDQVLAQRQAERDEPIPDDEAFEIFACEQVLREFDFSSDETSAGIVGGGNDGGIDGIYVILGDSPLDEDSEVFDDDFQPSKVSTGTRLLILFIQAKRTPSFTETAIDLVASSTSRLLDLSESSDDLRLLYSDAVVERTGFFRQALQRLATRHPKVEVRFMYATRGPTDNIDIKVEAKAKDLENQFSGITPDAAGSVGFLGASELWGLASSLPTYTLELEYMENATSGTSYVAIVGLRDYLAFLTDDAGNLRRHIFDWNVRDFEGSVEVNREIRDSLNDENAPEFWWLNNGVTVICSKTSIVGKKYVLDDVQIVNGLQTSHTIHQVLRDKPTDHPAFNHSLLVRILVTDDPQTRDRVIRATNRQTAVPAASLRATDEIQRSIEAYFTPRGWFYDRRKNYYRNIGKSPERIVSIPLLAQAIMAMGLSRPDNSRARPSSLLKRDDDYQTIFTNAIGLDIYLWVAKSQRRVDAFLKSLAGTLSAAERTNLRFHLSMVASAQLLGARVHAPAQLAEIAKADRDITEADLPACLARLQARYSERLAQTSDSMDKIAKSADFVNYVLATEFPAP